MKKNLLKLATIAMAAIMIVIAICACGKENNQKETYKVVFKNYNGTILSEQTVESGNSAQAPTSPERNGYVFNGWSGSYENITADTELVATFVPDPNATKYTVTFKDYDGTTISSVQVVEGSTAELPVAPTKENATFLGWKGNYSEVSKNEEVVAVYSDEANVFKITSTNGKVGQTVKVTLSLEGNVSLCAFSLSLDYDAQKLKLVNYNNELSAYSPMVNPEKDANGKISADNGGKINLAYAASTNKTLSASIIELEFEVLDSNAEAAGISVTINSVKSIDGATQKIADATTTNSLISIG